MFVAWLVGASSEGRPDLSPCPGRCGKLDRDAPSLVQREETSGGVVFDVVEIGYITGSSTQGDELSPAHALNELNITSHQLT